MNVGIEWRVRCTDTLSTLGFLVSLDSLSQRHSLYEPPVQISQKSKARDPLHSAHSSSALDKIPKITERRATKDSKTIAPRGIPPETLSLVVASLPSQNTDMTTVRSLQLKVSGSRQWIAFIVLHCSRTARLTIDPCLV